MAKISKWDATGVARVAVKDIFDSRFEAMVERENKLALECRLSIIPSDEQAAADKFPFDKWIMRDSRLLVNAQGYQDYLDYATPMRVKIVMNSALPEALGNKVRDFLDQKRSLRAQRDETERRLVAKIRGCSTWASLAKLWPEGLSYYQARMNAPPLSTALVSFDDINVLMPKKEEV